MADPNSSPAYKEWLRWKARRSGAATPTPTPTPMPVPVSLQPEAVPTPMPDAPAVRPDPVDWGQRATDIAAGTIGAPVTSIMSLKKYREEAEDPSIWGSVKASFDPLVKALGTWGDIVEPGAAAVQSLWEPGLRRRYGELRDMGIGHVMAVQSAYKQAKEAGEIPWWQSLPIEMLTDPVELLPGGLAISGARAGMRGLRGLSKAGRVKVPIVSPRISQGVAGVPVPRGAVPEDVLLRDKQVSADPWNEFLAERRRLREAGIEEAVPTGLPQGWREGSLTPPLNYSGRRIRPGMSPIPVEDLPLNVPHSDPYAIRTVDPRAFTRFAGLLGDAPSASRGSSSLRDIDPERFTARELRGDVGAQPGVGTTAPTELSPGIFGQGGRGTAAAMRGEEFADVAGDIERVTSGQDIRPLPEGEAGEFLDRFAFPEIKESITKINKLLRGAKISKGKSQKLKSALLAKKAGQMVGVSKSLKDSPDRTAELLPSLTGALKGTVPKDFVDVNKIRAAIPEEEQKLLQQFLVDSTVHADDSVKATRPLGREVIPQPFDARNAMEALDDFFKTGAIPVDYNLDLLGRVFGDEFISELVKARPGTLGRTGLTLKELLLDLFNFPRANISSVDLSFLLRQGGMMLPARMREAKNALTVSLQTLKPGTGQDVARRLELAMQQADNGRLWRLLTGGMSPDGGGGNLFIHRTGALAKISGREEAYLSTLAGSLPWVRGSERAYTTFLSKLRWDVASDLVTRYEAGMGRKLAFDNLDDMQIVRDITNFVNSATGRGPGLGNAGKTIESLMNAVMFSPRLFTSRIAAPAYAAKMMRGVAGIYPEAIKGNELAQIAYKDMSRTVAKQMAFWFGTGTTLLLLAEGAQRAGVPIDVGWDWRSSDFGKIRIGQSRYDVWAGYTQIARALGQLATGETKSPGTGEVRDIDVTDVLSRFARSKFNPSVGVITEYNLFPPLTEGSEFGKGVGFWGEDRDIMSDMTRGVPFVDVYDPETGGKFTVDEQDFWGRFFVPLFIRDVFSAIDEEMSPLTANDLNTKHGAIQEHPALLRIAAGIAQAAPAGLGLGVTTYTTLDDIAKEMTQGQPGGPLSYSEMQPYQRREAQRIRTEREREQGRTRTTGMGYELEQSRDEERRLYQILADRLEQRAISPRDARDQYFEINDKQRVTRSMASEEYFGEGDRETSAERAARTGRSRAEQIALGFYDIVDRAKEAGGGLPLTADQYNQLLDNWERGMIATNIPENRAAIIMLRMMSHRTEIPEALLRVLPKSTQSRYLASRMLVERHRKGELRDPALYGR